MELQQVHINEEYRDIPATIEAVDPRLAILFPDIQDIVDEIGPLDGRILMQLQYEPVQRGLIERISETVEADQFARTLSKVISMGEHAFYDKRTGRKWIDINPGDYVIAPSIQGKRIEVRHPSDSKAKIHLLVIDDVHIAIKIRNPLKYLNYLAR